jgi:serine/threonine protein kinase/WD40 repeat protein
VPADGADAAPSSAGDVQGLREAVERCLSLAQARGLEPALDEVCAQHPALAAAIRRRVARLWRAGLVDNEPERSEGDIPERLGDYVLLRRLGAGGMGVVYLAQQTSLDREVAVKLVRPELLYFEGSRARFRREVEAVARLRHPGIAAVYAVGEEANIPFYAMEYVAGTTAAQALAWLQGRALPQLTGRDLWRAVCAQSGDSAREVPALYQGSWTETCLRVTIEVGKALAHAHSHGVVHRDVKPGNVMLGLEGRVCLLDFGLAATQGDAQLTRSGAALGSVPYMAPEQVRGDRNQIGPWTDVWGLGTVLYELLTLQPPFGRQADEPTRLRILQGDTTSLVASHPQASWDLRTVVATALAPEVAQRYANAAVFTEDLEATLTWRPIRAKRPSPAQALRRWAKRRPGWAVGAFAAVAAVVLLPALMWLASARERDLALAARAEAERQTYHASLAAADLALRARDARLARYHLARCPTDRRGWEWQHLQLRAESSLCVIPAGARGAMAGSISGRLAVRDGDELRVLDDAGLGAARVVQAPAEAKVYALSPSGATLFAGDGEGVITAIDVDTSASQVLAQVPGVTHLENVASVLCAGIKDEATLVLDARTGAVIHRHEFGFGDSERVFAVRGERVVLAHMRGERVVIVDACNGVELLRIAVGDRARIALAPDGARVLVCHAVDRNLAMYDAVRGERLAVGAVPFEQVVTCAFVDGDHVAVCASDGSVCIVEAATLTPRGFLLGHESSVSNCHVLDAGRFATWGFDKTVRTWSVHGAHAEYDLPATPPGRAHVAGLPVSAIACAPRGDLVALGWTDGTIACLHGSDGAPVRVFMHQRRRVRALAFSADAASLLAWADDSTLVAYDLARGEVRAQVVLPGARINRLCVRGEHVAAFGDGKGVHVFDVQQGRCVRTLGEQGQDTVVAGYDGAGTLWWQDRAGALFVLEPTAEQARRVAVAEPSFRTDEHARLLAPAWARVAAESSKEAVTETHRARDVRLVSDATASRFWSANLLGDVRIWDADRAEPVLTVQARGAAAIDLAVAGAGDKVYAVVLGGVRVFASVRPEPALVLRRHAHSAAARWLRAELGVASTKDEIGSRARAAAAAGTLSTALLPVVLAQLASWGDDAERLCRDAQGIALVVVQAPELSAHGRALVERALALRADHASAHAVYAMLLARAAEHDRAVAEVDTAQRLARDGVRDPEPEWLAVRVAAHLRAGRRQAATAAMGDLERMMQDPRYAGEPQASAYYRSVRRLLDLDASEHGKQ